MPLRPVSDLGLVDPTELKPATPTPRTSRASQDGARAVKLDDAAASLVRPPPFDACPSARRRPRHPATDPGKPAVSEAEVPRALSLGDEPTRFLQIMVAGELRERLARASFELEPELPRLRHQKTIIAALIWRYVDPADAESLAAVSALLDEFEGVDILEAPGQVKVGANVPMSLKRRLAGAVLALRSCHGGVSAKSIVSALVVRYVDPTDLRTLRGLLVDYERELRPPRRLRPPGGAAAGAQGVDARQRPAPGSDAKGEDHGSDRGAGSGCAISRR